ncbi:MAG: hypothetical protein RLY57_134 [Candidatus Parcubacteria bacterium]|jgi:hypothetical protein
MKKILETIMGIDPATVIVNDFEPVAAGETVIGVIPDEIRKWHGYRGRLVDEYNAAAPALVAERQGYIEQIEQLHAGGNDCGGECGPLQEKVTEVERKLTTLRDPVDKISDMFWELIRMEFDVQGSNLGLRDGWQLVTIPKQPEEELDSLFGSGSDVLSGLLGSVLLGSVLVRRRPSSRRKAPAAAPAGGGSAN